jgi:hypothetical protein
MAGTRSTRCRCAGEQTLRGLPVQSPFSETYSRGNQVLYTIAVILLVLWILGLVTSYTMGGFIHVLLVIAVIMILLRVIQGQRL